MLKGRLILPLTVRLFAFLALLILFLAPLAEESWMEENYGQAYIDYRQKVRRYI